MADSQEVFQNEETVPTKLCEPSGDDVITDMLHEWESHTDGWGSDLVDDLILNTPLDFELQAGEIMADADNSMHGLNNEKRGTSKKVVNRKAATKTIWRKYGKKNIIHKGKAKGMVRCYYKCNYRGCDGKRVVEYVDKLPVDAVCGRSCPVAPLCLVFRPARIAGTSCRQKVVIRLNRGTGKQPMWCAQIPTRPASMYHQRTQPRKLAN